MNAGKVLIVGIFVIALLSAVAAWTHHYRQTDQIRAVWGARAVYLIAHAPQVYLLVQSENLENAKETAQSVSEVTQVRGMANIRYTLARDFAYKPELPPQAASPPAFIWSLQFQSGTETDVARLDFSTDCRLATLNGKTTLTLVEPAAAELRKFFKTLTQPSPTETPEEAHAGEVRQ